MCYINLLLTYFLTYLPPVVKGNYSSEVDSRQNYSRVHTSNLTEFVSASETQHFCSVMLKSLDLRHVNDDSNTN